VLLREHQGERHTVTVVANGYVWREATYASLSSIARAITGTAWNGPRFFGLRIDKGTTVSPEENIEEVGKRPALKRITPREIKPRRPDSLADDAVGCEPVSRRNEIHCSMRANIGRKSEAISARPARRRPDPEFSKASYRDRDCFLSSESPWRRSSPAKGHRISELGMCYIHNDRHYYTVYANGWAASAGGFPAMTGKVPFLMRILCLLPHRSAC
jgi:Protein of unknown function (DUF2924)